MKKIIIIASILISCIYFLTKDAVKEIIIPKDAIRFRVIANSNEKQDQALKSNIKDVLNKDLTNLLKDSTSIDQSRTQIIKNVPRIENEVKNTLIKNNSNQQFKVNYGMNYFPSKKFKGVSYPAGEYESLVVTLGNGQGENWWCVLFPPLCLLEAEESETEDVEYQFFIKKIIDKFSK